MNYFELYNLPESFLLAEEALKNKHHELSQQSHPDVNAAGNPGNQPEDLLINEAYRTLSNFDLRMEYILQQHGLLEENKNNEVPLDLLTDTGELNEQIKELENNFNPETFEQVSQASIGKLAALEADIFPVLQRYPHLEGVTKQAALEEVKNYYWKKKYLLRIQETLSKFATQS